MIGGPAPVSRAGKVDAPRNRGRPKAPGEGDLSVSSNQHATNQYEGPTRNLLAPEGKIGIGNCQEAAPIAPSGHRPKTSEPA